MKSEILNCVYVGKNPLYWARHKKYRALVESGQMVVSQETTSFVVYSKKMRRKSIP